MRHQDLTLNHILESWTYANAGARTGAGGFVSGDIGRVSFQTDTGQYWRLTATTPTWQLIAPISTLGGSFANLQTTSQNPTNTTSTTFVMMGLGAAASPAVITPAATGKLRITATGTIRNSTVNIAATVEMLYGTGSAPANGVAVTGTGIGSALGIINVAANASIPFCITGIITGRTLGTQLWIDLALDTVATGTAQVNNVTIAAQEIP